ncbi:enoyl-CoA hydratase/isomerase family protein [Alloacidobacterium dinghuense]|uniref:Enoyl-CoA hydratase/isomerase family protein n=1 Tax=Alloacidobacterium dinghuense TaxID=2763107 RepID=A0A7G8BES6_9BACT|nr:enoyl-CoA hydratase-related protein [Alloacidobacterium dinghuense]QNI31046.1 enoyl-CoA hydratase/isomerase family protein [Alloacidobacterium dinghuense]
MSYENILVEIRDAVAVVTLNRPKVLNALNAATLKELGAAVEELVANSAVRALLLTGAGEKAFAAGADIQELARVSAIDGHALALCGQGLFDRIENCGKPVIACVNGFALGGGCELALACTFRIASETAKFGQPEVKLGIIPGYGGSQRLPRLVGKGAALKMILTGEMIPALEALRIGLVEEVVAPDQLVARGEHIARTIAAQAPLAVEKCLEAVHSGYDLPLRQALDLEASLFGLCCATEDKAEGTKAFLEKRAAVWKGQ